MAQDKQVEYLHQQASALYLQGEYDAALEAWRQLLNLDPKDERAREGARLCELLVKETHGNTPAARRPAPAAPPAPPASAAAQPPGGVGFGLGEQLDQELSEIDEMLGGKPGRDWMDGKRAPAQPAKPPAPAAAKEALDFDLSDGAPAAAEFHFDVEAPDRPARDADAGPDAFDLGDTDAATAAADAAAGETAAEELQHRTNELMAEALEYYERGEREEALSALTRLTILDEHNEAALNFAAHIRSEMEQLARPAQPEPPAAPETSDASFVESTGGSTAREAPRSTGATPKPAPPAASVLEGSPAGSELEAWEEEVLADELSAVSAKKPGAPPLVLTRARPNRWLIIAAGGLVVAGAAYVALGFFGGSPSDDAAAHAAPLASPPPLTEEEAHAAARPAQAPAPAEPAEPVPLTPETRAKIDALMDRAEGEFESGDFAAAVLTYNDALKLDPENEVARKKLADAGKLFHEQKQKLEERTAAIASFNEGDYRNALRIFYRIEPVDAAEAQRLTHYKAIGWYNLGVRALIAGDCRLARSHLLESQQLDPLDRNLQHAMQMNAACFEGTSQRYYDAVRTLQLRGLED